MILSGVRRLVAKWHEKQVRTSLQRMADGLALPVYARMAGAPAPADEALFNERYHEANYLYHLAEDAIDQGKHKKARALIDAARWLLADAYVALVVLPDGTVKSEKGKQDALHEAGL